MEQNILLFNDITGYGKVSLSAMIPILSAYGNHVYNIPTAVVSNPLEYDDHHITDTSEHLKITLDVWKSLDFHFENIATGFINSKEEMNIINTFIHEENPNFVLVDPIMADNGELYDGMTSDIIELNRSLISKSNICVPNLTEACLLADFPYDPTKFAFPLYEKICTILSSLGAKDIIITGSYIDEKACNIIFDASAKTLQPVFYDYIPKSFVGTGDVFSSIIIGELLAGNNILTATSFASYFISQIAKYNSTLNDARNLYFEKYLKLIIDRVYN